MRRRTVYQTVGIPPIRASPTCSDSRLKSIMLQTEEAILRVSIDNRRGFSPLYRHR